MAATMRAALLACALVEPVSAFSSIRPTPSIVGVAQEAGQFNTLLRLVGLIDGLGDTLATNGPFTVLAPTDEAFAKLPADTLTSLENNPSELARILQYHVLSGAVYSSSITDGLEVNALSGDPMTFSVEDGVVTINDSAEVTTADVTAANGVLHIIDTVLIPPAEEELGSIVQVAVEAGSFNTLLAAASAVPGLVEQLTGEGSYTLFAPTDAAFVKIAPTPEALQAIVADVPALTRILQYHLLSTAVESSALSNGLEVRTVLGQKISFDLSGTTPIIVGATNGANITATDIAASNGVIHVIDTVLIPANPGSIVDVATNAGSFSTLLTLATSANLAATLATGGPFTIFAPSDAAFAALDPQLVATLTAPENVDQLASVLRYHLLEGAVYSEDLVDGVMPTTLNGATVTITLPPVRVNNANVTAADIVANNGVIHVIDAVLIPPVEASTSSSP
eukprot:6175818-Pleurochrysis_carterae.AAC.1